jgi:hypothetical protein
MQPFFNDGCLGLGLELGLGKSSRPIGSWLTIDDSSVQFIRIGALHARHIVMLGHLDDLLLQPFF